MSLKQLQMQAEGFIKSKQVQTKYFYIHSPSDAVCFIQCMCSCQKGKCVPHKMWGAASYKVHLQQKAIPPTYKMLSLSIHVGQAFHLQHHAQYQQNLNPFSPASKQKRMFLCSLRLSHTVELTVTPSLYITDTAETGEVFCTEPCSYHYLSTISIKIGRSPERAFSLSRSVCVYAFKHAYLLEVENSQGLY